VTWLAWRQMRANAALAVVATLAVTLVLAVTRDHVAAVAEPDELTTGYKSLQLLGTVLIGLPAFIGAFWGAPLLARELEMGTHRLVWAQSITRVRWLATKLAVAALLAVAVTGVFALVFTWWSAPLDEFGNRLGTADFGQRGIVPVAYALFALALGTLAGAALRRTLPAMAATLLGFFVVRYAFQLLVRGQLVGPVTTTLPTNLFGEREGLLSPTYGGWIVSSRTVDAAGHTINPSQVDDTLARACTLTRDSPDSAFSACVQRLGIHDVVTMHPAGQFWRLQAWEALAFLALAAGVAGVCLWWVRRRAV
jgi:hypothetical protein